MAISRRNFLKGTIGAGASLLFPKFSFGNKNKIKVGVVADIEGAYDNVAKSVKKFKREGVDILIIAGDVYENEQIRRTPTYPRSVNNLQEMILGIRPYAEMKIPVYVIPGNHELKSIYEAGIKELQKLGFSNVQNINNNVIVTDNFSIVAMGGYHHPNFTVRGGFLLSKNDYQKAYENIIKVSEQKKPIIFVTHGPPKSSSKIDRITNGMNVGDEKITQIMQIPDLENIIQVCGHIHEAGGSYVEYGNNKVSVNGAAVTNFNSDGKVRGTVIEISEGEYNWRFI